MVGSHRTTRRHPRQPIQREDGGIFRSYRYPLTAEQRVAYHLYPVAGDVLKFARDEEEMGQRSAAQECGCTQTDIRDIEHGGCYANEVFLRALADIFYSLASWEALVERPSLAAHPTTQETQRDSDRAAVLEGPQKETKKETTRP